MMRLFLKVYETCVKMFDLMVTRPVRHFFDDMRSLRAIWCWIILGLFCWVCIYVVRHNPIAHGTLLTVLGGVTSLVFTNYVFSKLYERKNIVQEKHPDPDESGGSD